MSKKQHRTEVYIPFEPEDCLAILSALPLLTYASATPKGMKSNSALITIIGPKLSSFQTVYTDSETRSITLAVELAIAVLTGENPDLAAEVRTDLEWFNELQHHYFTLNLMLPILRKIVSSLSSIS